MQLSIIVPVYQVEEYIRPCLISIYRQGLDDSCFEVIIVNDGTKDNSMGMIQDIISQHQNIIIVKQNNQGLSAARNSGLKKAIGTYILFLDSDDILVNNTLPPLLNMAMENEPDMLIADYIKLDDNAIDHYKAPSSGLSFKTITAKELFLQDLNPRECYVWNKLYNRNFLNHNHLRFIPDIYFEDIPFTTACYLSAGSCIKSTCTFYIYRQRASSICSTIDIKKIYDLNTVLALLEDIIQRKADLQDCQRRQVTEIMFATFSIALWYTVSDLQLYEHRKEIIKDLHGKVPNLYFSNTSKQRMVSMVFRAMPCTYLSVRRLLSRLAKGFK